MDATPMDPDKHNEDKNGSEDRNSHGNASLHDNPNQLESLSASADKSDHIAAPDLHEKDGAAHNVPCTILTGDSAKAVVSEGDDGSEDEDDSNTAYPHGLPLGLLTFGLCMATFTVALDNTIIATAIPKITTVFDSLGDVGWYGSSYLLTTTALQPSFGRIYTYFNVKYIYLSSLVLFELGSIICAAAKNSVMLIVGRAVAGAGASALFSGAMTIVGFTVPLIRRPMYIAAISSMFAISSVIGPLLGGALTDKASWRWCFWINLPFGAIALGAVGFFFKPPKRKESTMSTKEKILQIDLLGAILLICAIVCLLLALQWGGSTYPWSNSKVWGCLLGFGLLIIIFIVQQFRRGERATIPPRIFGQRTVLSACIYSCFLSMGLYTHIFYLPFYFQAVKGTSAEASGIRTIPYLASVIISSIIVGAGITVIGFYKPFMIAGGAIFTIGAGLIYTFKVTSSAGTWVGYQLLSGFGAGAGVQIPFIAVQVVLSKQDMPTGNAIAIFFNSLGGAVSISVAQNIFANGLKTNIPIYAPEVSAAEVISAGATHLRDVVSAAALPGVLRAYMVALQHSFVIPIVVGGFAAGSACFVEWKTVKGKQIVAAAA
ncbi:hypothetical protein BP5796_04138 [Coleophoma crateriformis]|uniref:Major facilitator superfamily (MFS) profile domain-containing protein n=1 Tax=Coleophoma crateriformis TaxID=565419 RepID=A0A3D8SHN9_9HELO|nr:hypothetical protein BP5796_04138 [Coleophoma crateriformis]